MLTSIIIDDQPASIKLLEKYVSKYSGLKLIASYTDAKAGFESLTQTMPDILFLDIKMPKINGMKIAENIQAMKGKKPAIVFSTGYIDFALKGYELDVADYLLKPIKYDRFVLCVDKIFDRLIKKPEYFFVDYNRKKIKLSFNQICYAESSGNYVIMYLEDERIIKTKLSMTELEELLPSREFLRVHKSFMVNKDKVIHMNAKKLGVSAKLNKEIPIGRMYKNNVKETIKLIGLP